jgi:hypothetical protein
MSSEYEKAITPASVADTTSLRTSSIRRSPDRDIVDDSLGFLADLAGTWTGTGFNLIARPDRDGGSPLFLELNRTIETLTFTPISSNIPNRGSLDKAITLFGLTYQQTVMDAVTKGALHIEEGMWVHVPSLDQNVGEPNEKQSIFRIGTIPHGNSLLAQGNAITVPSLPGNTFDPNAVNPATTAPFAVGEPMPLPGTLGRFPPYNLGDLSPAAVNFRTPSGDSPATPLPVAILGVPMQDVIDNPTLLLTAALAGQHIESMVVLNVATAASQLRLLPNPDNTDPPPTEDILAPVGGGGGVENIPFLQRNADAATVFATFWIEKLKTGNDTTLQLQYVQTVFLNFPIVTKTSAPEDPPQFSIGPNLTWPHVSVATLTKVFGGQ